MLYKNGIVNKSVVNYSGRSEAAYKIDGLRIVIYRRESQFILEWSLYSLCIVETII